MKDVIVECTWRAEYVVEVPDDFEPTSDLSVWPEEALEQMDPRLAELVDWDMWE